MMLTFFLVMAVVVGAMAAYTIWGNRTGPTAAQMVKEQNITITEQVDKRTEQTRVYTVVVTAQDGTVEEFWVRVIFNSKLAKWLGRVAVTWGHDFRNFGATMAAIVFLEEFGHHREQVRRGRRLPKQLHYLAFLDIYVGDWIQFTYAKMREELRAKKWALLNVGFAKDLP